MLKISQILALGVAGIGPLQAHAPAHTSLVTGRTAYIHNISDYAEASDLLFQQLQRWGRYRVTNDPREADLVFVIEITTRSAGSLAMQMGSTTARGNAWVDVAGRIHFSAQAYTPPAVAIPLTTTRAFLYVFARAESGELELVWRDSEPVGLREHKTAEKVVDRLRAQVGNAPRPSQPRVAPVMTPTTSRFGAIAAGDLPPPATAINPPVKVSQGASWTTRTVEGVGFEWHVVVSNRNASAMEAVASVVSRSADGSPLEVLQAHGNVAASATHTLTGESKLPIDIARRVDHWTIEVVWAGDDLRASGETRPAAARDEPPLAWGTPGLTLPLLVSRVLPEYTDDARRRGISGDVLIAAVIETDGTVSEPRLLRGVGEGELNIRAIRSVLQWRFEPGTRAGVPVRVLVHFTVTYRVEEDLAQPARDSLTSPDQGSGVSILDDEHPLPISMTIRHRHAFNARLATLSLTATTLEMDEHEGTGHDFGISVTDVTRLDEATMGGLTLHFARETAVGNRATFYIGDADRTRLVGFVQTYCRNAVVALR